jgi:signal peptidase I
MIPNLKPGMQPRRVSEFVMEEDINPHAEIDPIPEAPSGSSSRSGWSGFWRLLLDISETILLAALLFLGINAITARIRVESVSMQPTLYAGDFVLVNKLAYKMGEPDRGEVIVFLFPPDPQSEPYIKRIIGLPGDEVVIRDGSVFINGQAIIEPYIKAPPDYTLTEVIPENALFVLGDNRNNSSDSHNWGMVPVENVIGRAEMVYWPPSEWRLLNSEVAVASGPRPGLPQE